MFADVASVRKADCFDLFGFHARAILYRQLDGGSLGGNERRNFSGVVSGQSGDHGIGADVRVRGRMGLEQRGSLGARCFDGDRG